MENNNVNMDLDTGIKYQKHCERLPSVGNESDTYVIFKFCLNIFCSFRFDSKFRIRRLK